MTSKKMITKGKSIAEIMVASINVTKSFGDTIFLRIIAASLQSLLSFYIAKYFKNRKKS